MGKQKIGTKYLYRKSNCSLSTLSKTCSGASHLLSRSAILRLKKKHPKTNYYTENGKMKRDLSIETDKCILRSYYKQKFGRFKHCVTTTDVATTIDESVRDHNSCGDSIPEKHNEKTRLNIDVTSLVVENLKNLLNDWIRKYLVNDTDTKQKIDTVLDSILHKLELRRNYSSCTYTLDIKVDEDNKFYMNPATGKPKKSGVDEKRSCQTMPVTGKHLKLISTLSIPRNITKNVISSTSQYPIHATRKIRYKNEFFTISRSSTLLMNSSIFNLLSISTKSFTKRCATYDGGEISTTTKKHEDALLPKSSYSEMLPNSIYHEKVSFDEENKVYPNALEVEPVQSLVKSIYADDPANVTSTDRYIHKLKHDNYTMTYDNSNDNNKNVTTPAHCRKLSWKKAQDSTDLSMTKMTKKRRMNNKSKTLSHGPKARKTMPRKKYTYSFKCLNNKNVYMSNLYRATSSAQKKNDLMRDVKSIVKHFTHNAEGEKIKFDVIINVFSGIDNKVLDEPNNGQNGSKCLHNDSITAAFNVISKHVLPKTKTSSFSVEKQTNATNSSHQSQSHLISILDGAASQSKYVISEQESYETTDKNSKGKNSIPVKNKISTRLELAKDISELRVIIKDLAVTTEKFAKEHLEHLTEHKHNDTQGNPEENNKVRGNEHDLQVSTVSKCVQISNDEIPIFSGLKLKKEPKKKDKDVYNNGLSKKSISYNVIESESILKVTDMTSAVADASTDMLLDKGLNLPLLKSKSQSEVTGQNKTKLLAYYCDEVIKSRRFIQNCNNRCNCSAQNIRKYANNLHTHDSCKFSKERRYCNDDDNNCEGRLLHSPYDDNNFEIGCPNNSCSSVYVDVEDRKKFIVRSRSGMSFFEGLIYCILLWIPVLVICWLIYVYVIRDVIQPQEPTVGLRTLPPKRSSNKSLFHITLSDLGF